MIRVAALLVLALPAHADVGELSLRPHVSLRNGPLLHPDPDDGGVAEEGRAWFYGLGLAFPWTLTARYHSDSTLELRRAPTDLGADQDLDRWAHDRHALTAGIVYAPSDQWTPVVGLDAGLGAGPSLWLGAYRYL